MKKTDIIMLILIASISVVVAFFAARAIFPSAYEGSAIVKTIDAIDSSVIDPDPNVFNEKAINPTVQVVIPGIE